MPRTSETAVKATVARRETKWEVAVRNAKSSKTWHKLPLRLFIDGDYVRPRELNARQMYCQGGTQVVAAFIERGSGG